MVEQLDIVDILEAKLRSCKDGWKQAQARVKRAQALADKWESVTEVWDELVTGDWITLSLTEKGILKGLAKQLRAALAEEGETDEVKVG